MGVAISGRGDGGVASRRPGERGAYMPQIGRIAEGPSYSTRRDVQGFYKRHPFPDAQRGVTKAVQMAQETVGPETIGGPRCGTRSAVGWTCSRKNRRLTVEYAYLIEV